MSPWSTIARKALMALTGLFLCIFLVVHLGGNLLLVLPPDEARPLFNAYAETLSGHPVIRGVAWVLYGALVAHVVDAAWIVARNRRAAGAGPALDRRSEASQWAGRHMGLLGLVLLVFLVAHLRDLWWAYTFGVVPLDPDGHRDLYAVVQASFAPAWAVGLHLVAFGALGLHLWHGAFAATQTLGLHHPTARRVARVGGALFSAAVTAGFSVVAVAVHLQS